MSKAKYRYLSQANELRRNGVNALGSATQTDLKRTINPIHVHQPDKEEYKLVWTDFDLNQCCSRYTWAGLPNGILGWNVERMLYFRSSVCAFHFAGKVYILPYVVTTKGITPTGFPASVHPITFNGMAVAGENDDFFSKDFELQIDMNADENDDYGAVLLYDKYPYQPAATHSVSRYVLNQIIINDIADVLARVNVNIVVSNKKILLVIKDPKQRDVIQKEMEAILGSDSPFGLITSDLDIDSIQSTDDFCADDLFNTMRNYDAIRCMQSGIASKGFGTEKKERVATGELAGIDEAREHILEVGLELRQQFCEMCNKKFGTNISVKISEASQSEEEENGNGDTPYEAVERGEPSE